MSFLSTRNGISVSISSVLTMGVSPGNLFQLSDLFSNGQQGLWWMPESDRQFLSGVAGATSTLFQDAAGTTAVSAIEQPVGRVVDLSGRGNNATQSTSTARPALTARKNLLSRSEDLDSASWAKVRASVTPNTTEGPFGGLVADTVEFLPDAGDKFINQSFAGTPVTAGMQITFSAYTRSSNRVVLFGGASPAGTDVYTVVDVGGGWWRQAVTRTFSSTTSGNMQYLLYSTAARSEIIACVQAEIGPAATAYQRVTTAADYDWQAGRLALNFDGLDDSIEATFAAGSLPANADVYIVLNRNVDDGGSAIAIDITGAVPLLAVMNPGDTGPAFRSSGSPTATVNGVAVPGGNAITRAQLHTAVGVAETRLLEVRGANLASWQQFQIVSTQWSSMAFKGRIGAILICPAQTDANRARVRRRLAQIFGIQGVV